MKLNAQVSTIENGDRSTSSSRVGQWLRRTLIQASCISQSVVAAGAQGVDFFDPSAVRAANQEVLMTAAELDSENPSVAKIGHELADPSMPRV